MTAFLTNLASIATILALVIATIVYWKHIREFFSFHYETILAIFLHPMPFTQSENAYRNWLIRHQQGFVIDTPRSKPADAMTLHKASCELVNSPNQEHVSGSRIKVVATQHEKLQEWAKSHGRPDGTFSSECKGCLPLIQLKVIIFDGSGPDHDEQAYKKWLTQHPHGYVVNTPCNKPAKDMVLHKATCGSINLKGQNMVTGGDIKIAAEDQQDLQEWVKSHGRPDGTFSGIHTCIISQVQVFDGSGPGHNGQDYKKWIESHPHGYVVNSPRSSFDHKNLNGTVLHKATCGMIRAFARNTPESYVEFDFIKVCGDNMESFKQWKEAIDGIKKVSVCRLCRP